MACPDSHYRSTDRIGSAVFDGCCNGRDSLRECPQLVQRGDRWARTSAPSRNRDALTSRTRIPAAIVVGYDLLHDAADPAAAGSSALTTIPASTTEMKSPICPRSRAPQIILLFLASISCSGDSTEPDRPGPATRVEVQSGAAQTGTVGASLPVPIVVRVLDARGRAVPSVTVNFTPASGSVQQPSASTDGNGSVSVLWTLGTLAGSQTLTVSINGVTPIVVNATAAPGPPARALMDEDSVRLNALQQTVALNTRVQDSFGNTIPGAVITFASSASSVATVDAGGRITALANGNAFVRATGAGPAADSVLVRVQQVPAALALSPAALVVAVGASRALAAVVVDSGGSQIPGTNAAVRYTTANPAIVAVDPSTGVINGVAAGVGVVRASDAANPAITDSAVVAVAGANSILATALVAGSEGSATVNRGQAFAVPVVLDLSRVAAQGDLGAAELSVKFNATLFQVDSAQVLTGGVGNVSATGEYSIAYAGINNNGGGSMVLATLFMRVLSSAPAGSRAVLQLSSAYPPLNTSLTAYAVPLILSGQLRVR